jgi:hypothetical protein
LLKTFVSLPDEILIPDVLFEEELLRFTPAEKERLIQMGLQVTSIPGPGVARAQVIQRDNPALSINDCFAFVLAESNPGCILLTGDRRLRLLAETEKIEVHGLLWAIDKLHQASLATVEKLYHALLFFEQDRTVRLPQRELRARIRHYQSLMA